jgi:hypothetical protein
MKISYQKVFFTIMAVMFFTNTPLVHAAGTADSENIANVRHMSGEITGIDVKRGILKLKSDLPRSKGEETEYKIDNNETRVTDPSDKKFLTIDNLQAGQYVIVDIVKGQEDKTVKKIVAEPYLAPGLQQAFGDVDSIDVNGGTLILEDRLMNEDVEKGNLSNFVFEPKSIVFMVDPNTQPTPMVLKPGDSVRVVYVVIDDKKYAKSITLYQAQVTETIVTTTTTTTR